MFTDNIAKIMSDSTTLLALGGLGVISLALVKARRITLSASIMARISMAIALAVVLHMFRIYHLPQGGSITLGSMLPLLLMAFWYGPEVGFLAGFIYGVIDLIVSPYILHPVQVLFDYPLPFMSLGLAGYFQRHRVLGIMAGIGGRFICHFISGVVFFGQYAPAGMSPYKYSFVVNAPFLAVEGVICLILLYILPVDRITTALGLKN